jgi:gp16 family phage-associated protein
MENFVRSPEDVRQWLDRHGVSVTEWSRQHGFQAEVVFSLLSGRTRGRRGAAHKAAIALGLREMPASNERHPLHPLSPVTQEPSRADSVGKGVATMP